MIDPLSGIGLVSNIAQFLEVAHKLLSTSKEIYDSVDGSTCEVLRIETVHQTLQHTYSALEQSSGASYDLETSDPNIKKQLKVIIKLSQLCKDDCERLLQAADSLKPRSNSLRESFKVALKTLWKEKKIGEIEERLLQTQQSLALSVSVLNRFVDTQPCRRFSLTLHKTLARSVPSSATEARQRHITATIRTRGKT
jgi:hypothetical protein